MNSNDERQGSTMIEIRVSTGDWAEAEDAEGAVLAARTMLSEAAEAGGSLQLLTCSFIKGALEVGLEGNDEAEGLAVAVVLCEEIG